MTEQELLIKCNARKAGTLMETLDITFTAVDVENKSITARMPVTSAVHQPDGVLHGGATAALIETVGSVAVFVFKDTKNLLVRGVEISTPPFRLDASSNAETVTSIVWSTFACGGRMAVIITTDRLFVFS